MPILSYALKTVSTLLTIAAVLIKGVNLNFIQVLLFVANVVSGVGYIADGAAGYNAAGTCIIAGVQAIINYSFQSKNKPIPKYLIVIYAVSFIAYNIVVSGLNLPCVIAIAAALCFVMSIAQPNGKMFRFWCIFNNIVWIAYDLVAATYSGLIIHVTMLAVTIFGILLHDLKKKPEENT